MKSKIVITACLASMSLGMMNTAEASAPSVSYSQCDKRVKEVANGLAIRFNTVARLKNCTRINKTGWSGSAAVVYWVYPKDADSCTGCWPQNKPSPDKAYPECAYRYLVLNIVSGQLQSYWSPIIQTRKVDRPECTKYPF